MGDAQIGVYGLGTMGSALALNMAEKGIEVAVTNRETEWISAFMKEAVDLGDQIHPFETLETFVQSLRRPRMVLFMIPSGKPMDMMIGAIASLLDPGDIIIDGGNADFHDTRRREKQLGKYDLHFVGMGVSGGEDGARNGASMMVGGSERSWTQLKPILTEIAAKFDDTPCVDHLGPDGAGHFVKTVHNGIEYAEMQALAEVYSLLRNGAAWSPAEVGQMFADWNEGPLESYLIEITGRVLGAIDPVTGHPIVDVIKDAAGQKGTGRWTVVEAVHLGQAANMIEAAVGARSWSSEKDTRQSAEHILGGARGAISFGSATMAEAFTAVRILGYAQGFRILDAAAKDYDWPLDHARIAEIWRAGCIIRSAMLDDISAAFQTELPHGELILSPFFAQQLARTVPALREVVSEAVMTGHPIPVLSAALSWYDTMRQGFGSANVIQAQRDYFGRHGFERLGEDGRHHGPWWNT